MKKYVVLNAFKGLLNGKPKKFSRGEVIKESDMAGWETALPSLLGTYIREV
jgi:hypothetical protein